MLRKGQIRVAFLLDPRSLLTGITIPAEMLRAADEVGRVRDRRAPGLRLILATAGREPTGWLGGLAVERWTPPDRLTDIDLLYLPPVWRKPAAALPGVERTLTRLAGEGALVCAISTGAYPLARAGLLDGRPATTHWSFLDDFERRFPAVQVKRQHLITRSGNLYCAGSLNATADLTAHIVERLYDASIARHVEAQFSPEARRPASQQGFFDGEPGAQPDELMAEAQQWLRERAGAKVAMPELARRLGISRRSLNRRFREATGRTPVRFLQEARVEEATELLRDTNLTIAEVAALAGYDDPGHFATLFRRRTGQSPSRYRAAVRAKLFSPQ